MSKQDAKEIFKMNLYVFWNNEGVYKSRKDKEVIQTIIDKAINYTLFDDEIDILQYFTHEQLENMLYTL